MGWSFLMRSNLHEHLYVPTKLLIFRCLAMEPKVRQCPTNSLTYCQIEWVATSGLFFSGLCGFQNCLSLSWKALVSFFLFWETVLMFIAYSVKHHPYKILNLVADINLSINESLRWRIGRGTSLFISMMRRHVLPFSRTMDLPFGTCSYVAILNSTEEHALQHCPFSLIWARLWLEANIHPNVPCLSSYSKLDAELGTEPRTPWPPNSCSTCYLRLPAE